MAACNNNFSLPAIQSSETNFTLTHETAQVIFSYASNCLLSGQPVFSAEECAILARRFSSLPSDQLITHLSDELSVYHPEPHRFYAFSVANACPEDAKDKIFYPGVDLSTGESVAVLYIKPRKVQRHLAELRIIKKLTAPVDASPHIIRVLTSYTLNDQTITLMPLAPASDLYTYAATIAKKSLTWQLRTIRDIFQGLAYIHKHDIIHRDIKPENILVYLPRNSRGGVYPKIKITDFGDAVDQKDDQTLHLPAGTEQYFSPEMRNYWNVFEAFLESQNPSQEIPQEIIAASHTITTKTDVYSVHKLIEATFLPLTEGEAHEFWDDFQYYSPLQWDILTKRPSSQEAFTIFDKLIKKEQEMRQL